MEISFLREIIFHSLIPRSYLVFIDNIAKNLIISVFNRSQINFAGWEFVYKVGCVANAINN